MNYILQNRDRTIVLIDDLVYENMKDLINSTYTEHAKRKIIESNRK